MREIRSSAAGGFRGGDRRVENWPLDQTASRTESLSRLLSAPMPADHKRFGRSPRRCNPYPNSKPCQDFFRTAILRTMFVIFNTDLAALPPKSSLSMADQIASPDFGFSVSPCRRYFLEVSPSTRLSSSVRLSIPDSAILSRMASICGTFRFRRG